MNKKFIISALIGIAFSALLILKPTIWNGFFQTMPEVGYIIIIIVSMFFAGKYHLRYSDEIIKKLNPQPKPLPNYEPQPSHSPTKEGKEKETGEFGQGERQLPLQKEIPISKKLEEGFNKYIKESEKEIPKEEVEVKSNKELYKEVLKDA